jgi:predicted ATPase
MTSSTLREVEGFVQVRSVGAVQVKGVSRPVEAFEVVAATTARTRVQAAAVRGLTPLVGRRTEIEVFSKLVEQAASGKGQILAMVGEPGMGKSRLVHEFTRHQLRPGWLVLEGASVSYGKATPYFPLIEMLRHYFQIADGEGSENIRDQVAMHILELDNMLKDAIPPILSLLDALPDDKITPPADEHNWLIQLQDIGEMIKHFNSTDPQQRRRYTLDAVKRVLIRESQRQPLLAVFEDLHWVDHETQAFLDSLMESLPMAHILVLVNYRPGYVHTWNDKTYYTQIRVDPLQPTSTEELLQHLLGSNKDLVPLKELLIHRTEGNPFFTEESVRSLAETGVLVGEKHAYRPGLKIDEIRIPSTVQNVVADRIDRLPIEIKHLLQTAAVIGVIVPLPLLRAVAALAEDELRGHLAHLQAAEFLYETKLFPQLEYTFKHALTNEVAYGALLHERRTFLHARTVNALEEMARNTSQDYSEMLAQHAFYGELWDKAVVYLRQAGTKAMVRSANLEAVVFFERALDALARLPDGREKLEQAVDLRLELRNALFLSGEFKRLYRYLREAESFAEALGNPRKLGRVLNFLITYYGLIGEHDHAIASGERALVLNKENLELNTVTQYYMGQAYHFTGQYYQSMDMLNHALASVSDEGHKYERLGTASIISVICRVWLVQCLAQLGSFREGSSQAQEAIQIAEEANHTYSLAYAYCSLGILLLLKGDLVPAIAALEKCRRICEVSEIKVLSTHIGSHLGCAYALSGRLTDAIPLLEKSDEQSTRIGRKAGQSLRVTWHGQACLLAGHLDNALKHAKQALALAMETKEQGYQAWALKLLGDIALRDDSPEPEQPEKYYDRALGLARELGMRPLEAHCHVGLGSLYVATDKREHAHAEFSTAKDLYDAMGMTFWLMQAEAALQALAPGREASV